ncbi:hypothetical protein CBS101457_005240 [Exobasidium rhododendri]|nr:hypothetical protein CBS101457_005240 [Exobasidium rhododendri]
MSSAVASSSSHRLSDEAISATHAIHSALSPRIGVLSSPDVQATLEANRFTDFSDLLKPFENTIEHLTVRTSQLETRRCETFPLSFDSLDTFAPASASASTSTLFTPADVLSGPATTASETAKSKKRSARYSRPELLLDAISARVSAKSKAVWENRDAPASSTTTAKRHSRKFSSLGGNEGSLTKFVNAENEADLERYRTSSIDNLTPWFADTKSFILRTRNLSEHETFGHPLAILLVVSADSSDPMNAFASLFEASQIGSCQTFTLRPYVDPLILRYYVLLHDVSKSGSDLSESIALLENIKKTYGLHCCLLPINSGGPGANGGKKSSIGISELYRRAFQNDRRTEEASNGDDNDVPPKIPPKADQMNESEVDQSVEGEEKEKWYSEKEEEFQYGECLDEDDVKRIKAFVRDFAAQSLIPFLERCVSLWNDQLAASRKGLTGRLFGAASRKLFSGATGRGSPSSATATSFATLGYYPHATLEAQTRRLADFAFMTRDYKLAAAMYDQGRRDYANDKALKYIAGANEMFGLSHLMIMLIGHSAHVDVDSYLAAAGQLYLISPRQKGSALQLDSLRATLLYYEVYRGLSFYRSAPFALVRTATEGAGDAENDLEVAGAMLLEQAAITDLRQADRPALRKCALHLIMAAHRYRSCGQKHLSLRCFQGAASVYRTLKQQRLSQDTIKGGEEEEDGERLADRLASFEGTKTSQWDLIEDHMEEELGQQASSDGQTDQAVMHFFTLLYRQKSSVFSTSEESSRKHKEYLQGFLTSCKYLDTDLRSLLETHKLETSLPFVDDAKSVIHVKKRDRASDEHWSVLEREATATARGKTVKTVQGIRTIAVEETFWVDLAMANPLNTPLTITTLTAQMQDEEGNVALEDLATIEVIEEVNFAPLEKKRVFIAVSVREPSKLTCTSVRYLLAGQVAFEESLNPKGKRLFETKEQRSSVEPQYSPNEDLSIIVEIAKPQMDVEFKEEIRRLGLGEEIEAHISIANTGKVALKNAKAIVNRPEALMDRSKTLEVISDKETQEENDLRTNKTITVPLSDNFLAGGANFEWPVLVRGNALGTLVLRLLFVYETEQGEVLTSQLQHEIQVEAVIDLAVQAGPSHTKEQVYDLSIEGVNLSDPEEDERVTITALSFVSPAWKTSVGVGGDVLQSFDSLICLQKQSLYTTLVCSPSTGAVKDTDYTVSQLQSLLTGRNINKDISPPPTTINRSTLGKEVPQISPFLLVARKEYRLSMLQSQFASSIHSRRDLERIFMLYEPNEIDIVAHWKLSRSNRKGQAFVFGLNLGPLHDYLEKLFVKNDDKVTRSLYAEAEKEKAALWADVGKNRLHMEEDPILFTYLGRGGNEEEKDEHTRQNGDRVVEAVETIPAAIHHNFAVAKGGKNRCVFDVEFLLLNLSNLRSRDVILQLDNTPIPTPLASSRMQASYVNRLTFRVTIAPLSSVKIKAQASVHKAGDILVGPVLVKSTTTPGSGQERTFQRWEHCTSPIIRIVQQL